MAKTPGATTPGLNTPGREIPGSETPGAPFGVLTVVSASGVAVDATGTTTVGSPDEIEGEVQEVTVTPTAADFSFQILLNGTAVFDSPQSPDAAAEQTFRVDPAEDAAFYRGSSPTVEIEVTSASATGGATADVDVDIQSEENR